MNHSIDFLLHDWTQKIEKKEKEDEIEKEKHAILMKKTSKEICTWLNIKTKYFKRNNFFRNFFKAWYIKKYIEINNYWKNTSSFCYFFYSCINFF